MTKTDNEINLIEKMKYIIMHAYKTQMNNRPREDKTIDCKDYDYDCQLSIEWFYNKRITQIVIHDLIFTLSDKYNVTITTMVPEVKEQKYKDGVKTFMTIGIWFRYRSYKKIIGKIEKDYNEIIKGEKINEKNEE